MLEGRGRTELEMGTRYGRKGAKDERGVYEGWTRDGRGMDEG
jgi:hypothetical protein